MEYGWEFPTQLLVVVIVFTYAVICPVRRFFSILFISTRDTLLFIVTLPRCLFSMLHPSGDSPLWTSILSCCFGGVQETDSLRLQSHL
jgi:hypothetical protein